MEIQDSALTFGKGYIEQVDRSMDNMRHNLDEAEITLKDYVEKLGLRMEIKHTQFDKPRLVKIGDIIRGNKVIAMTSVLLYDDDDWVEADDKDDVEIVAEGYALCSKRDQFARKTGRVIAGYRALKMYEEEFGERVF